MKFLLIRFSSIGDIVLTSPVARCIKTQLPDSELHFLTREHFRSLVEANPYIDKVHTLAHSMDLLMHDLKLEEFDHIIDLHHNLRTLKIKRALSVPAHTFNKLNLRKWVYVNLKWNLMPEKHIVDRYFDALEPFAVKNDGAGLNHFIPEKEMIQLRDIPASHHAGYIAMAIGAAHETKKLPVHKLKEIAERINHPVILLGGKQDNDAGAEIAAIDPVRIYNACGRFSINESADLVRRAKLVISHDTGLMHIAAAFKRPLISIWGNTVPSFGMYPYYGDNYLKNNSRTPYHIVQVNGLWCRPCSKLGYRKCPLGHFKCMEKHNVDDIAQLAETWL